MEIGSVTLREYQIRDVDKFLDKPACLVAYDKRGGKTITSLALTLQRMGTPGGPVLIVSDKTSQWERELEALGVPANQVHYVDRPKRSRFKELLTAVQPGHFYQIHWAGLVPELTLLSGVRWHTIIADEAHAAKNRNAQRTKALKQLRTTYKIGLTADPDDNAPQDIYSLLNWLYPKQYTSFWRWVRQYVELTRETSKRGDYFKFGKPINVEQFQAEIEPFFVRMSLRDIDPGQVHHIYEEHHVHMTPEQATAYEQMVEWQMMQLGDGTVRAEYPMVAAMRLQQLAQAMGYPETREVWRWVTEDDPNTGEQIQVRRKVETTTIHQIEPSPKLDDMMVTLQDSGATIIYTQFRDMVTLACKRLDNAGLKYVHVSSNDQINAAERAFQSGEVDIIIGTTGLISESIELSRADTEIFLDVPWNPRVRGQAEARALEVGRRTPVRIVDIRTVGTVDFARLDIVRTKQEWKDEFLGRKDSSNAQS